MAAAPRRVPSGAQLLFPCPGIFILHIRIRDIPVPDIPVRDIPVPDVRGLGFPGAGSYTGVMITVTGSVETKLSAEKAFAFLSAFENTSEWDPSTPVMEKLTPGPVAVGHRYHAESEFRGKRQSLEYEVIELTENHIKLRGENKSVTAFDSIDVSPAAQGSVVKYTAEFSIKGPAKIVQPLLKPAFMSLRDPALNGIRDTLNALAAT